MEQNAPSVCIFRVRPATSLTSHVWGRDGCRQRPRLPPVLDHSVWPEDHLRGRVWKAALINHLSFNPDYTSQHHYFQFTREKREIWDIGKLTPNHAAAGIWISLYHSKVYIHCKHYIMLPLGVSHFTFFPLEIWAHSGFCRLVWAALEGDRFGLICILNISQW